jgi:hypothetical protein
MTGKLGTKMIRGEPKSAKLLDHRRILLCRLIERVDALVDLLEPRRLLFRALDDRRDVGVYLADLADNGFERLARLADQIDSVADQLAGRGDQ